MISKKPFKPHWTFVAFREGVNATLPLTPGLFAFGMAFGTVAARQGFSLDRKSTRLNSSH